MAKQTNFVVLIGGPGTFEPCDRVHDQTWSNYVVPIQIAMKDKQLNQAPGEKVHWWVYAPAYRERWDDDVADVKPRWTLRSRETRSWKATGTRVTGSTIGQTGNAGLRSWKPVRHCGIKA